MHPPSICTRSSTPFSVRSCDISPRSIEVVAGRPHGAPLVISLRDAFGNALGAPPQLVESGAYPL